ncbi:MAG: hypothetical protein ABSB70_14045 [Candidatus Velthaea sp.]|jgi:hypothetical protein
MSNHRLTSAGGVFLTGGLDVTELQWMQRYVLPDVCRGWEMRRNGDQSPFSESRIAAFSAAYRPLAFDRAALLDERFLLAHEGRYAVYYAPIDVWPRETARIIFVGLTPGFSQMKLAAKLFAEQSPADRDDRDAYGDALKERVAFAGRMRANVCEMLDEVGLPDALHVPSTAALFSVESNTVATTSALVFPTFANGTNLSGIREAKLPRMFSDMLESLLLPRLCCAPNALIVPLGKSVEHCLDVLAENHASITTLGGRPRILKGVPHPSPANGHRAAQFRQNRAKLEEQIRSFFEISKAT